MSKVAFAMLMAAVLGSCQRQQPLEAEGKNTPASAPAAVTAAGELIHDKDSVLAYGAESHRLVSSDDEIVSVLRNGMVVIAKRIPSPVTTVRGYVYAGGVYEGKWLGGGLSHLLEHLVAGGTNERRTEEQNRNLLQELGNNSNAYTMSDRTSYFVNTTNDNAEKAVDLITGWIFGAKITPAEYRREYLVVQRELEKYRGEPDRVFYELTQRNRYLVSPARVPVIGYQEVIQGLSRDDVYEFYKLAYVPNNILMVVVGGRSAEELLGMVQKNARDLKPGRVFDRTLEPEPPVTSPRISVATFPKLGQAKVQLGFPSIHILHPDLYSLDLLATVLGGGESSILVEEVRDRLQLVTSIYASDPTPVYVDGTFTIDFECEPGKVKDATKAVLDVIENVKNEGIDAERAKRAKAQIRTQTIFSRTTAESIAESLADGFMMAGDPHFLDRYTEKVQKVEPKALQEMAQKYLDTGKMLTTVLLPEESVGSAGLPKAVELISPKAAAKAAEKDSDKVERFFLADGTTVLVKRMAAAPIVSVQMYALGGVTAEDAKSNGLGNLAMQLVSRGSSSYTGQQIAQMLDAMGAQFEASCGNNSWNWKATCLKEDFGKLMELYADLVKNANFPETEVGPMKERMLAAIESQDADWFAGAFRYFRKQYFGETNSPYQFMPLGTSDNVKGATKKQIEEWYRNKVLKGKRVLAIYGDVDVAGAKDLVAKVFKSAVEVREERDKERIPDLVGIAFKDEKKPAVNVVRVEVQKTSNPQAAVMVGFKSDSVVGTPAMAVLDVADCLTSGAGYPTGYIFEILRGRGLVYDANAFNFPGADPRTPGAFIAYAGCDPKNVDECAAVILESLARLQGGDEDIVPTWFERSKKLIVTNDAIDNEAPDAQATVAAMDELFGLGYDYHAKYADRITKVSVEDVRKYADQSLNQCVITISTPSPELVKTKAGVREFTKFPPVDLTPRGVQHDSGPVGK